MAIASTAEDKGDHWLLNGSKTWISNADVADVLIYYAYTDQNAGSEGLSAFVIEPKNVNGVKLTEQEKFYANRRGSGTPFFRHAELNQMGVPVLAGIYGTNPAGGGYQGISSTILFAHKDCNIAVGGGILSGMASRMKTWTIWNPSASRSWRTLPGNTS